MVLGEGQKWVGVALEMNIENGVVRRLAEIAEKAGIIIRFIQVSMVDPHATSLRAVVFLDFFKASITPEEALKRVKTQEFVKKAHPIYPSREGILSDDYFFPLIVANERAVIFRKIVYGALFRGLREKFGTAGEAMLYYQGFNLGYQACHDYANIAGSDKPKIIIELAKTFLRTMGWGIIEIVKMNLKKGEAQAHVYESFECEIGKGSKEPYGHFSRGLVAGFFTYIFGKEANAAETRCVAKGDPYCEFTIKT